MAWLKRGIMLVVLVLLCAAGTGLYYARTLGFLRTPVYDTDAPPLPISSRPLVLVLDKTNGFIHRDAIPAANNMLAQLAAAEGWDIHITTNAATHNAADLQKVRLLVWNNVTGDVLTEPQREALKDWISSGGGWVGLHGSGGTRSHPWDWYVDTLLGARFLGHTLDPQFQDALLLPADGGGELTSHLPTPWPVAQEEWYAFDRNPRSLGHGIVLTIDPASYVTRGESWLGNDRMPGEHPLAWRHTLGKGRVFYSAIGHQAATYQLPEYRELVRKAMRWAMGQERL